MPTYTRTTTVSLTPHDMFFAQVGVQVAFAQVPRGKNITRGRQIIQLTVKR